MMGIRTLIEDAEFLWGNGRKFGAFALVLISVSATSRKRYPRGTGSIRNPGKRMRDNEAFKRFVLDEMGTITGGPKYNVKFPFQGKDEVPLEDIVYEHLRCHIQHEGTMPDSVYLTQTRYENGKAEQILKLTKQLGFPEGWISNMAAAVRLAPENQDEFGLPYR